MISFNPSPISSSAMTFPSLSYKTSLSDTSISPSSKESSLSSSSSSSSPSSSSISHLSELLSSISFSFSSTSYHLECHSTLHLPTFDRHSLHHQCSPLQSHSHVELH